ncbi:MAG: major outer membrane protein [Aliarcobacter sp.]|nr:major outer membrane protein [Aliarcobacter sp.]
MKITKLSLAAFIALGSFSYVNAQNLEDAIKNVEVSGTVAYRYNDYEESTSEDNRVLHPGADSSNNYKAAINVSSKVNDDVTFNSRFIVGNQDNAGENVLNTQTDPDENFDAFLSEANFAYSGVQNSVFTLGKQGISTPFTLSRDALGNESTGTGIVATTHIEDMVSLTGGYFNQTNFNSNNDVFALNRFGGSDDFIYATGTLSFAGMTLDATYGELNDQFDAYSVGLTGDYTIDQLKLNPYARYSSLDLENSNLDNTLWKAGIQANLGIFGAYLAYGKTNDEGGSVAVDASSDAGMDDHWRVTLTGISDAEAIYASVDTQVTDKINIALKYSGIDVGANSNSIDQNEIYVQAAYKMSNNLSTYIRLGQLEKDKFYTDGSDLKSNIGRAHVQYSF